MRQRIISGIIIAAAVIGLGLVGTYPLYMICMLCGLTGYLELAAVLCPRRSPRRKGSVNPGPAGNPPDLIAVPGLLLTIVYYAGLMYIHWRYGLVNRSGMIHAADFLTTAVLTADFLLTMCIYVFTFPRRKSARMTGALVSFFYAPVLMAFLCRTRALRHGVFLYLLIFVCASISDVCALAAGMVFGRHKLAPVLSPKKTIEGSIGGILGAGAVSALLALVLRRFDPEADMMLLFIVIGVCGSIIGQIGDLAASAIKRNAGIKDYGTLIPGHGGIMDRFDSILFTAPVIYFLSLWLTR